MRFLPSFLDEIKGHVPISTLIRTRVSFDRKKTNAAKGDYWGCCPFHGEKTPSFHCEDSKGRYYCFGCGVTGDHFQFLSELEGLSFSEAVERVADMAGVPMPIHEPKLEKYASERAPLYDVMNIAATFFQEQLHSAAGVKARAYLRDRGLLIATQQMFRLGYAPEGRNILKEHLLGKGVTREHIEACGLVVHGENIAVSYDRFRNRIMFPIEDMHGRIIAFGGRTLSPDVPAKYLNSPETELFHKGKILYNILRARKTSQKQAADQVTKSVIAVEGYMDVIALTQTGIGKVVAPLGTALTHDQLELLWQMSPEPILCFDGDRAGLQGAYRVIDLALSTLQLGRSLYFAILPEGKDPDDLIKVGGGQAFQAILKDARPLVDMLWTRETMGGLFDTPERRAQLETRLREITAHITDANIRRHYAQDMRNRVHQFFGKSWQGNDKLSRNNGRMRSFGQNDFGQKSRGTVLGRLSISDSLARSALVRPASSTLPLRETAILLILLNHPHFIDENPEMMIALDLEHPSLRKLYSAILDIIASVHPEQRSQMREILEADGYSELIKTLDRVVRRARIWTAMEQTAEEDARASLKQAIYLHQRARTLHKELRAIETALMTDETGGALGRLVDIQNELHKTESIEALIEGFGVLSGRSLSGF